jgi:hypothetical protein
MNDESGKPHPFRTGSAGRAAAAPAATATCFRKSFGVIALIFAAASGGCQMLQGPAPDDGRVQVAFENPAHFTDVRSRFGQQVDEGYLESLRRFIGTQAPQFLGADQRLSMTFRNIDMAGDFEPFRGPRFNDVRIVKRIYPPLMVFNYTVTDAVGNIVREGDERLLDMSFDLHPSPLFDRDDSLFYEKQLLRDWMARTLR